MLFCLPAVELLARRALRTNAVAPTKVAAAAVPRARRGAMIVIIFFRRRC
jgi:hypothetical protein